MEKQESQLQFLTCSQCSGYGRIEKKLCSQCSGYPVVAWTGNELLYWGKKISFLQIAQERSERMAHVAINAALLLFGASGIVLFGWAFFNFLAQNRPLFDFFTTYSWQMLVFWVSVVTDGYLLYRFHRELEKIKHIPKKKFQAMAPVFRKITWDQAQTLPKAKRIDVSKYFTAQAHDAINKTWQNTHKFKDYQVAPIHLMISLVTFDQIQMILSRIAVSPEKLRNKLRNTLRIQPDTTDGQTVLGVQFQEILFEAYFLSYQLREKKVEVTELFEALASQDNDVKEMLYDLNIDTDKIRNVVAWLRIKRQLRQNWQRFQRRATLKPKTGMDRAMTAIATPVLDAFSQDLTLLARAGYLMPAIGRERETELIFQIMQGGTRRSAVLVGESGVGKNTIVEGIAQRMVEENVPRFLQDKRLVSLSIARLVSGVPAAEAQQRLLIAMNEIKRSGNIILYIEDIHDMTGITSGNQGSIDLADVLAKNLESGILAITSTTPDEYRRYLEHGSSLGNTLEKVAIAEVSGNEAIQILESKAGSIEYKNNVFFSYDAIAKTVELSSRYMHDRYLPEKAIEILQEAAARFQNEKGQSSVVNANDIATIISSKTNIPLTDITQEESEKLLNLEDRIHERVVDQVEAVEMVASSLRRARADVREAVRPIVNLLFLGPTGVGKTELAKTVAEVYFNNENNMIRLDMSEYQEKASVNRLIGAPPGYGGDTGGYLSEAVRKNPFSLVLLDEIEKAHPDILNIFLQIMDDGRLTDNTGRTIDFTNTIIIATSNAGTQFIQQQVAQGTAVEQIKNKLMEGELLQYFRPEFINRFDGVVVFKPLSMEDVQAITRLMLNKIRINLEEKGIGLEVQDQAIIDLANGGYDPQYGARPLRRLIQQKVQDPIANYLLANQIKRRDIVVLETGEKVSIKKAREI